MSDMLSPKIQIAVCSHKRPQMLANTLRSLGEMTLPENADISLIVVDNDTVRSAEDTVLDFKKRLPFTTTYHCEPRRGIPVARNHALQAAIREKVDYLVFIDDDEWVEKEWLRELFAFASRQDPRAFVVGHVISDLPSSTPNYLRPFFQRSAFPAGTLRNHGATNNILLPMEIVSRLNLRFDDAQPLNGGDDALFFETARQKGINILSCPQAVVHETIPQNRAALRWISIRKFRVGINSAKRRRFSGKSMGLFFIARALAGSGSLLGAGLAALFIRRRALIRRWLRVCKSAGSCYGVLGGSFNHYRTTDGD